MDANSGTMIKLKASDGHTLLAYRTGPETSHRGLVIAQEIFGVNHHIRSVCDAFAAQGFAVIAPALFDRVEPGIELGYGPEDVAKGRDIRAQISNEAPVLDIEAAADALPREAVLGIVGYCWGGTLAWWGATRTQRFKAAVAYYGGGIAATAKEVPVAPVLMHFGDKDSSIPAEDVAAIRKAVADSTNPVEVHVYKEAGHGFSCDERGSFDPGSADLAKQRTLAFLAKHLG